MIKEVQNGTKQIGSEEKAREKQLLEIQKFINLKWVYIERQVTMIWLYNQQQNLQYCGDMLYTSGRSLLCAFWQQHEQAYSTEGDPCIAKTPIQWKVPAQHM